MACAENTGHTNETGDISKSKLFLLVVTKDPGAVKELKRVNKLDEYVLSSNIDFQTCGTPDSTGICDCWFALEYFEFLQDGAIDQPLLDQVIANIDRGKCMHVQSGEQHGLYPAGTTLRNAAAAAGNKPVIKYLKKTEYTKPHLQTIHLAIMKSHKEILHLFTDVAKDSWMNKRKSKSSQFRLKSSGYPWNEPILIVRRDVRTGNLVSVDYDQLEISSFVCLLIEYDIKDEALIEYALSHEIRNDRGLRLRYTYFYCLTNKRADIALQIRKLVDAKKRVTTDMNDLVTFIFACVLLDEDDCLKELLRREAKLLKDRWTDYPFMVLGYNMLDVALTFGSERCASVLQEFIKPAVGIQQRISPYYVIIEAIRHRWFSTQLACDLVRKCAGNGYNINATYDGYTPLHMAIEYAQRIPESLNLISTFLENGSDTNTSGSCGFTPLQWALHMFTINYASYFDTEWARPCKGPDRTILQTLLYYNPSPDVTGRTTSMAIHFDARDQTANKALTDDVITVKSDDLDIADDVLVVIPEDRLLCVSHFATLYELGFSGENIELELQQFLSPEFVEPYFKPFAPGRGHEYATRVYSMFMNMITRPRSLKSCCRIAIRKALPGTRLHKHLANSDYPPVLRDYILRPFMLRPLIDLKRI